MLIKKSRVVNFRTEDRSETILLVVLLEVSIRMIDSVVVFVSAKFSYIERGAVKKTVIVK